MGIELCSIGTEDGPVVRKLAADCTTLDLHTPYTYWVICNFFGGVGSLLKEDGKPVGYIMNLISGEKFFIWQIGVLGEYRRRGLATRLIDASVSHARRKGAREILVTIAAENQASYRTFQNYCQSKGLPFEKAGDAEIKDLVDKDFRECETVYRIRLADGQKE